MGMFDSIRPSKDRMLKYSDEYYTSKDQVKDIIERVVIDHYWKILCPFDTAESEFVIYLKENGYDVTYLKENETNLDYDPEDYDLIITNPPWRRFTSLWSEYIDRCDRFMIILSWTILFQIEKFNVSKMKKLRSFANGKYRSNEACIVSKYKNSDKKIGCFYLYKGFNKGNDIQEVKIWIGENNEIDS